MSRPRVSVVITTYERDGLCIRAVESALAQSFAPDEILIWDDGSSADARSRLRDFVAQHSEVVQLVEGTHAGTPAVGRNRLVAAARGEWIGFLDDDDEWLSDKLERQLPYLKDWDVVGAAARRRSNGSTYLPHAGPISRTTLLKDNVLIFSTVLVRRELLQAFQEDPSLAGVEDYVQWLALADVGARFINFADVLVVYNDDDAVSRLSDGSLQLQHRLARHTFGRWRATPFHRARAAAVFVHGTRSLKLASRRLAARWRFRR